MKNRKKGPHRAKPQADSKVRDELCEHVFSLGIRPAPGEVVMIISLVEADGRDLATHLGWDGTPAAAVVLDATRQALLAWYESRGRNFAAASTIHALRTVDPALGLIGAYALGGTRLIGVPGGV
jgi:hypothetical protein